MSHQFGERHVYTNAGAQVRAGPNIKSVAPAIGAVPLGRLHAPDEVAKAVVFLGSSDGSYITGIELSVDGGFAQV